MNGNGTVEADLQETGQHQSFSIAKILWTSSILWAILWRNLQESLTLRCFKEELTKKGLLGQLFNEFYAFLEENNLILHEGTMIDGSFVEVPRQRNTREENKQIKEGKGGELWNPEEGDTEEEKNTYIGKGVKRVMRKFGMKDKVIKRNTRDKKISKWQETINRKNSKLRVRVEHVFGYTEECLHGMSSRVVGFARNAAYNTLTNLVYNLCRYEQIMRLGMN